MTNLKITNKTGLISTYGRSTLLSIISMLGLFCFTPFAMTASESVDSLTLAESIADEVIFSDRHEIEDDTVAIVQLDDGQMISVDSIATDSLPEQPIAFTFNPDPTRAVWLSALFPGLGQVYNRRYWKIPIVVGGFMGITYALTWNNRMLGDYTQGYRDIMDNDPSTKCYLDFFPSYVKEEDLDTEWLKKTLKSRKDFYRRNRDLSIICMVGMYLLCMLDAYVDASLSQFDITPDISMNVSPAIIDVNYSTGKPSVGLQWAFVF